MSETIDLVLVERDGPVAIVLLNRPEKRNAMNSALVRAMIGTLDSLHDDDSCRVVVLTGAGPSFCAGMDLREFFDADEGLSGARERAIRDATEWRYRLLRNFPKPTIAMVNGACFGGGFSIVECCDLAIASTESKFGLTEINFRHITAGPVSKSMASILRPRDALYLALTGRPIDGRQAEDMGLVNKAVAPEQLRSETLALAHELAGKDAAALRLIKESYRYSIEMGWDASLNFVQAKSYELLARQQPGQSRTEAVLNFRAGDLKPGAADQ